MLQPVVDQVAETGYTGPLGVDSMRYESEDGGRGWRPVQDINARFTMGRCALAWSGKLPAGSKGTVLVARWSSGASVDECVASFARESARAAPRNSFLAFRVTPANRCRFGIASLRRNE